MSNILLFLSFACLTLFGSSYLIAQEITEEEQEAVIEEVVEEVADELIEEVEEEDSAPVDADPSESFVPSEDIIADSSISFPSDI